MRLSPFASLCLAGLFAIFSSTISKSPVLPLFATHLGADPARVGFIAAVSAFTGVLFSVPAGLLADRLGKRRMLLLAGLIFATAPFGYLAVTTIWQLALVRFYHGFATAIFIPVAMARVSELFVKERGEKMGWFSTATLLGRFMAPIVGGTILGVFVLHPGASFQVVYLVCGLAGLLTLLLISRLPADIGSSQARSWGETWTLFQSVAGHPGILVTSLVEAAILFAYGTFETFLPLYAITLGLSAYQMGILLSAQVITLALSKPYMGKVSDNYGRRPQIFAGALLGAVCIGAFSLCGAFVPLLLLSVAFGLSLSILTSATSAYIADLSSGEARGSAMGLLGSIMDMGHTAGPFVSGMIVASLGFARAFQGTAMVLILAALIFLGLVGVRKRP